MNLWGVDVSTVDNTFSLPTDKIQKAKMFLSTPDFDPGVTRIPLKALQELRGRVEFWSCCNSSLGVEMRFIDRLLVSQQGISHPKGSLREIKQSYIDFWSSVETIRIHMSTADFWSNTYTTDLAGALTLGERLSFPHAADRLIWVGSDATLVQCAAIDYTHNVGTVFPFEFCLAFLSDTTGLPLGDFILIAIAEFLSFLCFLCLMAKHYTGRLVAYVGDNANVISWIKFRKPGNRVSQFFTRWLNRLETEYKFVIFPCFISSKNNYWCGEISRTIFTDPGKEFQKFNLKYMDVMDTFKWFVTQRLHNLSLVLPTDEPERVQGIMQFVEKRISRSIPVGLCSQKSFHFLGQGPIGGLKCGVFLRNTKYWPTAGRGRQKIA